MNTAGKVLDATVIMGSLVVGYGAGKAILEGMKSKSTGAILLGSLTLAIGIYAFKEAYTKINE